MITPYEKRPISLQNIRALDSARVLVQAHGDGNGTYMAHVVCSHGHVHVCNTQQELADIFEINFIPTNGDDDDQSK